MDSKLVDINEFNKNVENWAIKTRNAIIRRAPIGFGNGQDDRKLIGTKFYVNLDDKSKAASNVRFVFPRHGVYVHYGVGRGWVRQGNTIVRGSLKKSKRSSKRRLNIYDNQSGKGRKPVDWFDIEIKRGIRELAEIAQEFYGDKALMDIIENRKRYLIEK